MSNTVTVTLEQPAIEVPFYRTKRSLICTISKNGHVWGKRLDKDSKKGDIELEIFAPYETACFVRRHPSEINQPPRYPNRLDSQLYGTPPRAGEEFTVNQKLTIANIFAQKKKIDDQLKTLMLSNLHQWLARNMYGDLGSNQPNLGVPENAYNHIKILDCTNRSDRSCMPNPHSHREQFKITYNDATFSFLLTPISSGPFFREHETHETGEYIPWDGPSCTPDELGAFNLHKELNPGKMYFHASVAKGGEFNLSTFPKEAQKYRIQYGEFDLFEYARIDEALLFLEVISPFVPGKPLQFYWTLALAKNKKYREDLDRIFHNLICWLRKQR